MQKTCAHAHTNTRINSAYIQTHAQTIHTNLEQEPAPDDGTEDDDQLDHKESHVDLAGVSHLERVPGDWH